MLYIYIYTYQSIMNMYVLCEPSHFKGSEPKLHLGQSHQAKSSSQADPFRHSRLGYIQWVQLTSAYYYLVGVKSVILEIDGGV